MKYILSRRDAMRLIVGTSVSMLSGCRSTRSHLSQVNPLLSPDPSYFEDRALSSGINFQLGHGGRSPLTILETMGTGCAIFDYDGDGYADILLIGQTGTQTAHCSLFHNNGNGTFTDVTRGSGLEQPGLYMGCAVGDFDNDGRPDVLLTGYGVLRLFRNLGQGRFEDVSKDVGLYSPSPTSWHSSAIFADFDRDGYLDLYVARYVVFNSHTIQLCNYGQYKSSCGPIFYDPQIGSLYRNIKGQRFEEITQEAGLTAAHGKTLGVAVADVNGDGWPDIYLANDEMPGDLFINNKGKAFHNEGLLRGVALNGAGQMQGGMGVDFGDYDNDGLLDLFVATFENEPDVLYQASKSGIFMDMSIPLGIATITRPLVGFGCKFLDIDNDGWLDLAIANGHIHDNEDLVDTQEHYRQPMLLFHNQNGQLFADITAKGGMGFTTPMVGRGLAIGDLNNDGRMDIVTVDLEGKARLLINQFPNPGNWIRITLEGRQSNRMGIGARVTVYAEGKRWVKECTTGGSYLSASDVRLHFGLGTAKSVEKIEVHWPSGKQSIVTPLRINRDITIVET